MQYLYIFCVNVLVFGDESVVDKSTVLEGESFTINCGHLHVNGSVLDVPFQSLWIVRENNVRRFNLLYLAEHEHHPSIRQQDENCHSVCKISKWALRVSCRIAVKHARLDHQGLYLCDLAVWFNSTHPITYFGTSRLAVMKESTTENPSRAPSNVGKLSPIALSLMMIAGSLKWQDDLHGG